MSINNASAVIFDRDGTLVVDVPYNGDPQLVEPLANAREALDRLRREGLPLAVVSNQSGVARGFIDEDQVRAVNARVDELLGPFVVWLYCPHGPNDGCECRKPQPKLIRDAALAMNVDVRCCVVIGDKDSDIEAARNAGAAGIKIDRTRTLSDAVDEIVAMRRC